MLRKSEFVHTETVIICLFQETKHEKNGLSDDDNFEVINKPSAYQILSDTLPEIRTIVPKVPVSFSGKKE